MTATARNMQYTTFSYTLTSEMVTDVVCALRILTKSLRSCELLRDGLASGLSAGQ